MKRPKQQSSFLEDNIAGRREDDFYRTPAWMTQALLRRRPLGGWGGRIIEPCVGDGAIIRQLPRSLSLITNDIVARAPMLPDFLLDARVESTWQAFARVDRLDIVLTNPTFEHTFDIAKHAREYAGIGVALLQRITWMEPTEDRGDWLKDNPPTRVIVLPRWNFRHVDGKGGSDSAPPAWFLWAKKSWFCEPGVEVVTRDERDELHAKYRRAA